MSFSKLTKSFSNSNFRVTYIEEPDLFKILPESQAEKLVKEYEGNLITGPVFKSVKQAEEWIEKGDFKKVKGGYKGLTDDELELKRKGTKKFAEVTNEDEFLKACHEMAKSIYGDAYNPDLTDKTAYGILNDHKDEGFDAMLGIFKNGLTRSKSFSTLPLDQDPSVINSTEDKKKQELPKIEFTSLKIGNLFGTNIEPWLIADSLNNPNTGIYAGSLESDEIKLNEEEKILLNIKTTSGQPMSVIAFVNGTKVYVWKCSQMSCGTKSFSTSPEQSNYSFDLMPTEIKLDMEHLIGTLMLLPSIAHLYHICDTNYVGHIALDELYKDFPELIDALAEHYLAENNLAKFRICIVPKQCPIDYLTRILEFVKNYEEFVGSKLPSAYHSQLDDITNFIQGILYKLKRLESGRRLFSDANKPMSKLDRHLKMMLMEKDTYKGFWPLSKFLEELADVEPVDPAYKKIPKNYYHLGNGDCLFDDGLIDESKFPDDKEFDSDKKKVLFEESKKAKRQMRDGSFREFPIGLYIHEFNTSVGKIILAGVGGFGVRPDFFGPKEVIDKIVNQAYINKLMK